MSESNPAASSDSGTPPEEDVVHLDDVSFADEFVPQNPTVGSQPASPAVATSNSDIAVWSTDSTPKATKDIESAPKVANQDDAEAEFQSNLPTLRYTAFSFFVMFSAFQTTQTMVTSMFTDVGNISLAVLYTFYSISCLVGPTIVDTVGIKRTICGSAVIYVVWVAATIPGSSNLFLVVSALVGFAGGTIWIAQGVWMGLLAKGRDTGRYNGAFLSIFFLSVCAGNLLTGGIFIFNNGKTSTSEVAAPVSLAPVAEALAPVIAAVSSRPPLYMLIILTITAAVGCAMIFFMPNPAESKTGPTKTLQERLVMLWHLGFERRTLYLLIYYMWIGIGIAFGWSRVPMYMPISLVPWSMVLYGVGLFGGSLLFGHVFDKHGAVPLIVSNLGLVATAYIVCYMVPIGKTLAECWPFFITTFCLGSTETLLNVLCQSIILKYWDGEKVSTAFSLFRVVTGITVSLGFMLLQKMSSESYMALSFVLLAGGCASLAYHELVVVKSPAPTT